ncbi:MAG: hypothetical protein COA85_13445 [Robiginitomaculum sp.]|nr:MAG: hypothetical protein COA85_13445 [Robiginitomaculum sp.]
MIDKKPSKTVTLKLDLPVQTGMCFYPVRELTNDEVSQICTEYEIKNAENLKEDFACWTAIYEDHRLEETAASPSEIRNSALALGEKASALAENLNMLSQRTVQAVSWFKLDDIDDAGIQEDAQALSGSKVSYEDNLIEGVTNLDLELIEKCVRVLAWNAKESAKKIQSVMDEHGRKKPPRDYKTKKSLMIIISNLRDFWLENTNLPFTCNFKDVNDKGSPGSFANNPCSRFCAQIINLIDNNISGGSIQLAMQENINWERKRK